MAPVYSKMGCKTCKRRRKKCDEGKPVCRSCSRLGLPCHYGPHGDLPQLKTGCFQIGMFDVQSPHAQVKLLPSIQLQANESSVISRLPAGIVSFFTPAANAATRDVKVLMQMVLTDPTVRSSVVSCFSTILPTPQRQLDHLNRISFGSALRSVRSQISNPNIDDTSLLSVRIAIQFLGLMDSCGRQQSSDPTTHWIALSTLTRRLAEANRLDRTPLPLNLSILALEAVLYHFVIFAPFINDIAMFDRVWQRDNVYSLLCQANPEGPDRLPRSPLLAGQYELWRLAFEAVILCRSVANEKSNKLAVEEMKDTIEQIWSNLKNYFSTSKESTPAEQRHMLDMYDIHCTALMLLLTTLELPTPKRSEVIRKLADDSLQNFLEWQMDHVYLRGAGAAAWALKVVACGISCHDDWNRFRTKAAQLAEWMDPGHQCRLHSVLDRVVRARGTTNFDTALPGSLFLLHQPEGFLHEARVPDEQSNVWDRLGEIHQP